MPTPDLQSATELRGLALPATRGPGGLFESKSAADTAWGAVLLALFTPRGGRFMRRSLGSSLHEQLFEPVTPNDFPLLDYTIREASDRQLSSVRITRADARSIERGIELRVFFRMRRDLGLEESRTVLVPKTFVGG